MSDLKGIKGKVGLLSKHNMTRCLANHQLSTSYQQLQLSMANSAIPSHIKQEQKGKLVYSTSTITLGVQLITSYPLAITSCSQQQIAMANSSLSSRIKKVYKEKLVYSTVTRRLSIYLITSYPVAITSCSQLDLAMANSTISSRTKKV